MVNTIIGRESEIKGSIHSQGSIRIEGTVEGDIVSQGEVVVGEKSTVKANIYGRQWWWPVR